MSYVLCVIIILLSGLAGALALSEPDPFAAQPIPVSMRVHRHNGKGGAHRK
jgi:hypothetical protein